MIIDMFSGKTKKVTEEKEVTIPKLGPFDFLNSINSNKPMEFGDAEETAYIPFLINRGLSYFSDTIMYANLMNRNHQISSSQQYHFLLNVVRPRKRFSKWLKRENSDNLEFIKSYYGYSTKKAEQAISLLSAEQIEKMKYSKRKGGNDIV